MDQSAGLGPYVMIDVQASTVLVVPGTANSTVLKFRLGALRVGP